MSISLQTNVNSLVAQENLRVNNEFQSQTIERLTSGYKINSSGDDAAGLAVANKYRSDVAELEQGVSNANDAVNVLETMDGGLNNISNLLDRLKTLATQSASGTFSGDRDTLNNEFQTLLAEIDRQAANIGLVAGGDNNKALGVYIGGGSDQANAQVTVDLGGSDNQVDSAGLGLSGTTVAAGGTALTGNSVRLDNTAVAFLASSSTQAFTFQINSGSGSSTVTVTLQGDADGLTQTDVLDQLNTALGEYGITASTVSSGSDEGELQFSGSTAFTVSVGAVTGTGSAAATATSTALNTANYHCDTGAITAVTDDTAAETVTFTNALGSATVTFDETTGASVDTAIAAINAQTASLGIYAVKDSAGTGISIQSTDTFTVNKTQQATAGDILSDGLGAKTVTDPSATTGNTANALAALAKISAAVTVLGQVQGRVGTGENQLGYAIELAQSQISSFSAAESTIRDADVAAEAANLTQAQILQQATIAAMAQANSANESVLSLLQG
ncbi:MAG: flagellin [Bryobacteraceae bacterium]